MINLKCVNNNLFVALSVTLLMLYFVVGYTPGPSSESGTKHDYWPIKSWKTSTPEQQGVGSSILANAPDYVREQPRAAYYFDQKITAKTGS